ncbi:MAG: preprotein translocase subunit SecE [Fimbriiglobus sp.]|nr:preprotein translocase subunit SecE [Fimbriiglobus sp.]
MSTATVEPTPSFPPAAGFAPSLLVGSLVGSVIVLAGLVAGGYAAATLVSEGTPYLEVARLGVYLLVVGAAIAVAGFLAGRNPTRGVSGGIILTVSIVIAAAFLAAAFAANFKDGLFGPVLTGVTLAAAAFGVFRLLTSQQGISWCQAADDQGWASVHSHKRTQGVLVRRCVMLGILTLGVTGAYALGVAAPFSAAARSLTARAADASTQPAADLLPPLNYPVPFVEGQVIPLIPVADRTLPALVVLLSVWVAWRAVNVPVFGDFLIATEAEMNKVSWTSRRQLIKDTIVVLVFLTLLTLFLFVIDLFWSWLLSLEFIGIIPSKGKGGADAAAGSLNW